MSSTETGRSWGRVAGGVDETRSRNAATDTPRPDGAQPQRVGERVRRGRATPPATLPHDRPTPTVARPARKLYAPRNEDHEIGRASCRERVENAVVAGG